MRLGANRVTALSFSPDGVTTKKRMAYCHPLRGVCGYLPFPASYDHLPFSINGSLRQSFVAALLTRQSFVATLLTRTALSFYTVSLFFWRQQKNYPNPLLSNSGVRIVPIW